MHPAIDYWPHILPYLSHLFCPSVYMSEILRNVNPICQLPSGISFHCKEQRPNYPCRLATLRCLNGRRLSVHNGNHNGVVRIFVGLSWELFCWWLSKWTLEQWCPSLRSTLGQRKWFCCCLSLRNARAFHLLRLHCHHYQPWQNSNNPLYEY